jgi:hypothetical protein
MITAAIDDRVHHRLTCKASVNGQKTSQMMEPMDASFDQVILAKDAIKADHDTMRGGQDNAKTHDQNYFAI